MKTLFVIATLLLSFTTFAQQTAYIITNKAGLYKKPDEQTTPKYKFRAGFEVQFVDSVNTFGSQWLYINCKTPYRRKPLKGYILRKYTTANKEDIAIAHSKLLAKKTPVIVDGVEINQLPHVKFCELFISFYSPGMAACIDYGQEYYRHYTTRYIRTRNGKVRQFTNTIDVFNFMAINGWQYISTHNVQTKENEFIYYHLFKKKE